MDLNLLRGILLVLLIIGFMGMCVWAWSRKRIPDFERLSRLPLEEDHGRIPEGRVPEGHIPDARETGDKSC